MSTVTLSSKGQLVIPKAVRERANVSAGSSFAVRFEDGEIRLRPLPPQAPQPTQLVEVAGCLARPGHKRLGEAQVRAAIQSRLKARNTP